MWECDVDGHRAERGHGRVLLGMWSMRLSCSLNHHTTSTNIANARSLLNLIHIERTYLPHQIYHAHQHHRAAAEQGWRLVLDTGPNGTGHFFSGEPSDRRGDECGVHSRDVITFSACQSWQDGEKKAVSDCETGAESAFGAARSSVSSAPALRRWRSVAAGSFCHADGIVAGGSGCRADMICRSSSCSSIMSTASCIFISCRSRLPRSRSVAGDSGSMAACMEPPLL